MVVVVITTSCKDNHTTSLTCCGCCWRGCYWWSSGWGSSCNRALCCGKLQQIQTNTTNTNKYSKKSKKKKTFPAEPCAAENQQVLEFSFWGIASKHWSNHTHLGCFLTLITSRLFRIYFQDSVHLGRIKKSNKKSNTGNCTFTITF